jgi:Cu+-exporting ATPase
LPPVCERSCRQERRLQPGRDRYHGALPPLQAKGKTSEAITRLCQLAPPTATLVELDETTGAVLGERVVPTDLVHRGDVLSVLPGARIPADGEVLAGSSHADESMLTGESCESPAGCWAAVPVAVLTPALAHANPSEVLGWLAGCMRAASPSYVRSQCSPRGAAPQRKEPGDQVIGGTVNVGGPLRVRTSRVGADTALAQIVRLVESAQLRHVPLRFVRDVLVQLVGRQARRMSGGCGKMLPCSFSCTCGLPCTPAYNLVPLPLPVQQGAHPGVC